MRPESTPFGIIAPGTGPFVPPAWWWLIPFVLLIVVIITIFFIRRCRAKGLSNSENLWQDLHSAIDVLFVGVNRNESLDPNLALRISRLIRHYIDLCRGTDLLTLGPSDLRLVASKSFTSLPELELVLVAARLLDHGYGGPEALRASDIIDALEKAKSKGGSK